MRFQLTQFSIARYSESLSSDSTNTNFEINLPLACKNPLLTDNLIVQAYCTASLYRLMVQPYGTAFSYSLIVEPYWTALMDDLIEQPYFI